MRNLIKKCLCFLFAVVMIVCVFPIRAYAVENTKDNLITIAYFTRSEYTKEPLALTKRELYEYKVSKGTRLAFYPYNSIKARCLVAGPVYIYYDGVYHSTQNTSSYQAHIFVDGVSTSEYDNIFVETQGYINFPYFDSEQKALDYINSGEYDKNDLSYSHNTIYDIDGSEIPIKYDGSLGIPQNVVYKYVDGQQVSQSGIKDHVHTLTWTNKDDSNGCNVQIQYGGTYKVKKSIFSSYETVNVPFTDICELSSLDKKYQISGNKFDLKSGGVIYNKITELVGYQPYQVISSTTSRSFRLRYLKYDGDKLYYGKWVYANKDGNGGNTSYVGDEDGNVLEDEDYGTGVDTSESQNSNTPTSISDFFEMLLSPITDLFSNLNKLVSSLFTNANNIISSIGSVPVMLSKLLSFMPAEVWTIITLGMAVVILLRIFGR